MIYVEMSPNAVITHTLANHIFHNFVYYSAAVRVSMRAVKIVLRVPGSAQFAVMKIRSMESALKKNVRRVGNRLKTIVIGCLITPAVITET